MFKMSNKVYDTLKFMSLTDVWGFKYGAAVAATVSAVGILLGAVLTKSSADYKKGEDHE